MNTSTSTSQPNWTKLLNAARQEHHSNGSSVLDALCRLWPDDPNQLLIQLEEKTGVPALDAQRNWEPVFDSLSEQQAQELQCFVLTCDGDRVLAAADPWNNAALHRWRPFCPPTMRVFAARGADLKRWGSSSKDTDEVAQPISSSSTALVDSPVVAFVNDAITSAIANGASDIHVECDRHGVTIKHRLDGVIQMFSSMQGVQNAQEIISRIKVLAHLDITESRVPQDGRFRFAHHDTPMDLRVSIMPGVHGEDAVLRLLDKAQWRNDLKTICLDALGFDQHHIARIRELASEPSGMLLVTGPTGSGKTTTLYAALSEMNTGHEKLITIEDPVEYELEGVLQIPVNERKGLTFAKGLRSILRHDPDRILVGEIRDAETAEIAVQASLTGHQVFTTVHANNIADIMGRFRHFGLDMFGFTSSLNGVVVQRLVRKLCTHCREPDDISEKQAAIFEYQRMTAPIQIYQARGCQHCHDSGYCGRSVLAEVHAIDDTFRDLIISGATVSMLKEHARTMKINSLQRTGLTQVAAGMTTLEELQRVVGSLKTS